MIPMLDFAEQCQALQPEIDRAMQAVAASGHSVRGPQGAAFIATSGAISPCSARPA